MTKDEALAFDLALEALQFDGFTPEDLTHRSLHAKAITAIKQARALDKMAENARELGLDYEPAEGTQISKVWWDGEKLMAKPIPFVEFYRPVQQKPSCKDCRTESPCRAKGQDLDVCSVYVPPPAQEFVCSTGLCHYRKPLTDESVVSAAARVLSDRVAASCNVDCGDMWMLHGNDSIEDARAMLEAAEAKLKENT